MEDPLLCKRIRFGTIAEFHARILSCIQIVSNFYVCFLDLELVKLPEDITLAGFTPLMLNPQDPCYVEKTEDMVSYKYII